MSECRQDEDFFTSYPRAKDRRNIVSSRATGILIFTHLRALHFVPYDTTTVVVVPYWYSHACIHTFWRHFRGSSPDSVSYDVHQLEQTSPTPACCCRAHRTPFYLAQLHFGEVVPSRDTVTEVSLSLCGRLNLLVQL